MAKAKETPAPATPVASGPFVHPRFGELTNVRDRKNGTCSGVTAEGKKVYFFKDTPSAVQPAVESEPVNVPTPAQPVPDAAADTGTAAG